MSCATNIFTGIKISVIKVAKRIPKPRDIPIGIRNCAVVDFSTNNGASPKNVVRDVKIIGRKRTTPAFNTLSKADCPASLSLFT
jgi:hypothetical protein